MVTKTLNGVIHGRTIELTDDPGLNEGVESRHERASRFWNPFVFFVILYIP